MRIPIWLHAALGDRRTGRRDLAGALWGQYALFLHVRLQDDLLDGRYDDLRLLFIADLLLLESLEAFQRLPGLDERFWAFYGDCLRRTIEGGYRVGALERRPGAFRTRDLALHARVNSIFKVGAAAVAWLHGREPDLAWISRLQDQLAITNQIEDDLRDLPSDLRSGRYTWVANTLLGARAGERITRRHAARRLAGALLRPERGARIVAQLRRSARAAAAAVPPSAPRAIHELVRAIEAAPGKLERRMHEARVRWLFGKLRAGAG